MNLNGKPVSTQVNSPPPGSMDAVSTPTVNKKLKATQDQADPTKQSESAQSSSLPTDPESAPPTQKESSSKASSTANSGAPQSDGPSGGSTAASPAAPGGMGICYDTIDSQTKCKSPGTINSEFAYLKGQGYGQVRVYDIGCPIGDFASAAAANGLMLMAGLNTINNLAGDLEKLAGMLAGQWGAVETIYIGNELVNNGQASAGDVANAVSTARGILQSKGFSGNVVTVDTFNQILANPSICSTSDFCAANTHAFFDPNTVAADAGKFVFNAYNNIVQAVGGKKVVITESGWPYKGSCNGQACPSVENQKAAVASLQGAFAGSPGNLFMFQAYNAGYKQGGPLGIEQFFGIYDSDHN